MRLFVYSIFALLLATGCGSALKATRQLSEGSAESQCREQCERQSKSELELSQCVRECRAQ